MIAGIRTAFVTGIDFSDYSKKGRLFSAQSLAKLKELKTLKNINIISLPITKSVCFSTGCNESADSLCDTPSDFEIESFIDYCHKNGVRVLLKPILAASFDKVCENKANLWFDAYRDFALNIAKIALITGCSMFSLCGDGGFVSANQWRELIAEIKTAFNGFLGYAPQNQNENISFCDCLDFINMPNSFSDEIDAAEVSRLSKFCEKLSKPLFICEKMP